MISRWLLRLMNNNYNDFDIIILPLLTRKYSLTDIRSILPLRDIDYWLISPYGRARLYRYVTIRYPPSRLPHASY